MPAKWSAKDERQYKHIVQNGKKQGKSTERAEEIAARTVNKQRRSEGRTPNSRSQGTGNPNSPLEERSRDELYNRARQLQVAGRSKMTKGELLSAVRRHQ